MTPRSTDGSRASSLSTKLCGALALTIAGGFAFGPGCSGDDSSQPGTSGAAGTATATTTSTGPGPTGSGGSATTNGTGGTGGGGGTVATGGSGGAGPGGQGGAGGAAGRGGRGGAGGNGMDGGTKDGAAGGSGGSKDAGDAAACPIGGGPLPGMAPDHCMNMFQTVGVCRNPPPDDGGAPPDDAGGDTFPTPSIGHVDDDDDCKYRVSFTNTCVEQGGTGTVFTVTLTSLTRNMMPVTNPQMKAMYIEAFLSDTHPANTGGNAMEITPGVYRFPPVKWDASGKWTVRFHFFGDCDDAPMNSPHAHAAFFINVP